MAEHPYATQTNQWEQKVLKVWKSKDVEVLTKEVGSDGRISTWISGLIALSLPHIQVPLDFWEPSRSIPLGQVLYRKNDQEYEDGDPEAHV